MFREKTVSAVLCIVIVGLGLFPKPVFSIAKPALIKTLNIKEKTIHDEGISKNETREKSIHFYQISK